MSGTKFHTHTKLQAKWYYILKWKFFKWNTVALKWILKKQGVRMWAGFMWLRIGTVEGFCEHDNKPLGSIRGMKFLYCGFLWCDAS
jgi:hypothetical protein